MRFHPAGLFLLLPLALAAHDDNTDYSDAALHVKRVFAERERGGRGQALGFGATVRQIGCTLA
ncbi:hypothetical protein Verru16b_00230 [Lacunisphaera limnophila]|uniref:Uncharacterized protein n=1 Tax=Lacunisphaera limnophila TaxID=1838286 RepID=A0A1I7PHU2_9BACT|nr:hypothetical protein Verru16b_00230 [Lacunisphaera limnophila]